MFFIVNRTRRLTDKSDAVIMRNIKGKAWPLIAELGDFVSGGDTLELVEITSDNKHYYGIPYIAQRPLTYGMERVNGDRTGYLNAKQKAIDWLMEKVAPTGLVLPRPRCPCGSQAESNGDLQSLADTGLCWRCRLPKQIVIKKKKK